MRQLDKLVGLAMLVAASAVFLYYTVWTLLMVRLPLFVFTQVHKYTDLGPAIR